MKNIGRFLVYSLIVILLTGCSALSSSTANKIVRPENKAVPIQGYWTIKSCYEENGNKSMVDSRWIGKTFAFQKDSITFDGVVWENVDYKMKRVNAGEYFLHKTLATGSSLDLSSKDVYVITASSQDKYLYEFIKLDEERIIASIDNQLYCMSKATEEMEGSYGRFTGESTERNEDETVAEYSRRTVNTGLLLGLRIPAEKSGENTGTAMEEYAYKTLWISMRDYKIAPVLSASDIYLPRKDGFWKLKVSRETEGKTVNDRITAAMVTSGIIRKNVYEQPSADKLKADGTSQQRAILYVGNDFICTENTEEVLKDDASSGGWKKVLRTIPVDNINNTAGVKLSDLAGEDGSLALEVAVSRLLASSNSNSINKVIAENQEQNFALFRKTGHWFFKGRLNLESGEPLDFVDFNINIIPPSDMVAYDLLHLPWTVIKDKVPEAIDAYTSPNKDLAVILTRDVILLYAMEEGQLSEDPMNKLVLPEGGTVIMAEWATGEYVDYWDKSFIKNNPTEEMK